MDNILSNSEANYHHNALMTNIRYHNKKRELEGKELIPKLSREQYLFMINNGKTPNQIQEELREKYNYGIKKIYYESDITTKKEVYLDFEQWKDNIFNMDNREKEKYITVLRKVLRDKRNKIPKREEIEIRRQKDMVELQKKIEYLESLTQIN